VLLQDMFGAKRVTAPKSQLNALITTIHAETASAPTQPKAGVVQASHVLLFQLAAKPTMDAETVSHSKQVSSGALLHNNALLFRIALTTTHAVIVFVLLDKHSAHLALFQHVSKLQFAAQTPVTFAENARTVHLSVLTLTAKLLTNVFQPKPIVPQEPIHAVLVSAHKVKFTALVQILAELH